MVERLHRQLKAMIMCQQQHRWTQSLPIVLLGIRSAWKEDLQATAADMASSCALYTATTTQLTVQQTSSRSYANIYEI